MKYDFTSILNREGKDAIAVEKIPYKDVTIQEGFSRIPMWVADMNFATAPVITRTLQKRIEHPIFGYFEATKEYYETISQWQMKRNKTEFVEPICIGYENGVLGGVISAMRVLCARGDKVLLHSPAYIGFTHVLHNNGYTIIHSPLVRDQDGVWRMNYEDMERKIKDNHIHTAIFCSPHNPSGRVWEKWEIEKAIAIYKKNDVYVISDEIWSDIILEGYHHIPTQSVSEDAKMRTIAFYSPSKTFNLAGLVGSYHIIYNSYLQDRMKKEVSLSSYNNINVLSMYALLGAYSKEGEEWVEELQQVLTGNVAYAYQFIVSNFQGVHLARPQGTYMLFLDCETWCREKNRTIDDVLRKGYEVGIIWQDGRMFGGDHTIRINLALPFSLVEEAMLRLKKYVFTI